MKFTINHNRDKAYPYAKAMTDRGYTEIERPNIDIMPTYQHGDVMYITNPKDADIIFVDNNWTQAGRGTLGWAKGKGIPAFKIPHGARGDMFIDAIKSVGEFELCNFVPASGYKEVYKKGGYKNDIFVTGWPWCKVKPFNSVLMRTTVPRVLFAPVHPRERARLIPGHAHVNKTVIGGLRRLSDRLDIHIYGYKDPLKNALPSDVAEWATYIESTLQIDDALKAIESVDVVIAHETLAYLAIASGKPTIMLDDSKVGLGWYVVYESRYWPYYKENYQYPFCWMTDTGNKLDLIKRTVEGGDAIALWKKKFIGRNFSAKRFVDKVETYL